MIKLPAAIDPSVSRYVDGTFGADARGRTALTKVDAHVRDLIIAVLFTKPGERVNQPEFGCGLRQLVFAPNGDLLASATEALVAAALNRWLSDWIVVQRLAVSAEDSTLRIALTYVRRDTREVEQLVISR
jgi:phage baseplate assembly protein W